MKICDIHTHVLPGVDDGAQNLSQALQMLQNAHASDVTHLVLTPHCNRPDGHPADLEAVFQRLRKEAFDIPVELALGAEVHVSGDLPALLRKRAFPTINGSRYLLTEFPFPWRSGDFLPMLEKICSLGYVPVIAHPERYHALWEDTAQVYEWLEMGCHIQLTAGSILGKYGARPQKCAANLLKNGLACCVASDAHGVDVRSNNLLEVQSYLALYYSRRCANALLWENPMTIWSDDTF